MNPMEERKLTGTGKYDLDEEYYSDDFEEESDCEDDSSQQIQISGCSGSTFDPMTPGKD